MNRIKLATVWLDGCSGCHMSFLDMDERLLELSSQFDLVYSPLVDFKVYPEQVDIALVEGAVSSIEDEHKIHHIRAHTTLLIAMGDCAVTGNVPAMRNPFGPLPILQRAYHENASAQQQTPSRIVPALLEKVRPVHEFVDVDLYLPGCPPSADTFFSVLTDLLAGTVPNVASLTRFGGRNMSQTITIDPVTRLEGHGRITLQMNEQGEVSEALFSVTQVRGFEKFCEGRPYYEMPALMARICGICPVSHLIASAKACEAIMAVEIPPTAAKLRRALNLAQCIQSHALSFFYLASPDLLLGMDADPAARNIFGVAKAHPELGRAGVGLRRFGQHMIELLGRKRIHPGWVVPGGVTEPLDPAKRDEILALLPQAYANVSMALTAYKQIAGRFHDEIESFANFPGLFMGMIAEDGGLEFTDARLRIIDATGIILLDGMEASQFDQAIGEAVEPFTYMKFPYYRSLGYPAGCYRVGPLARLNIAGHAGTPLADAELKVFKKLADGPVLGSFHYHHARLIEILHGIEVIEQLFADSSILDKHVRATAGVNRQEGAGIAEAPRGTLMHHYKVDEKGLMKWANLIIATGQNNHAMNKGILQAAQHYVKSDKLTDGMLNRVEAVIRTFDPCLSCSTHAFGQMPLAVELLAPDGTRLDEVCRPG